VRVNCVVPGTFLTDVSAHWDKDWFDNLAQTFALRRGGQPEEIVGAVLYFASQASTYTTGACLDVNGGWS
jgi:NAD(P)-dependent dehydrogenase (short-subunit alcohol dehydrogenase family)